MPAMAGEESPRTVLWAWERNEDLSAIDPDEFAIAYFACHVALKGDSSVVTPRLQSLNVPPNSYMIPVVRMDADKSVPPTFSMQQAETAARLVSKFAFMPGTKMLQIDFDALESQRGFYEQFLKRLRELVPREVPLSITALASWCLFDNWMQNLGVDETVPMMFSLGRDRQKVLLYFKYHRNFLVQSCCKSLGLSLEDPEINQLMLLSVKRNKIPVRVYFYTRTAWSPKKISAVRSLLGKQ